MREEFLVDWVNTLPLDSCLLVSSLDDLKGGRRVWRGDILCEIFNLLFNDNQDGQFLSIVTSGESLKDRVSNFQLLLSSLPTQDDLTALIGGKRLEEVCEVDTINKEDQFILIVGHFYDLYMPTS